MHPDGAIDDVRAVLRILIVFALVTPFWSLFDQKASTWILQGNAMRVPHETWWWPSWLVREPAQMQALNPLLVMALIPLNNILLYPFLRRMGYEPTALRRMGWGIGFSGLAWIGAGLIQLHIDSGASTSLAWQILPYILLTTGEILVSATALEFAYSQATAAMKGVIMAFWYLSVTFGNLWVLLTNAAVRNEAVTSRIAGYRLQRERVPDVLLRGVRVWRRGGLRAVRARLPRAGPLPRRLSLRRVTEDLARCLKTSRSTAASPTQAVRSVHTSSPKGCREAARCRVRGIPRPTLWVDA